MLYSQAPTANLRAYYPLNHYMDLGPNSFLLSPNGVISPMTDRFANVGESYYFNGTAAYFETPNNVIPATGDYTVNVWIQHNSMQTAPYTIISQNKNTGNNFSISIDPTNSGQLSVGSSWATGFYFAEDPMWHMITIVKTGTDVSLYLDGVFQESKGSTIANPDGNVFRIGRKFDSFTEYFDGSIDDVRVYSAALTNAEIDALYNENHCLRAYYPFSGDMDDVSEYNWDISGFSGVSISADRFNESASAYYFSASGSYMHTNNIVIPTATPFAVNLWAKHLSSQSGAFTMINQDKSMGSMFSIEKSATGTIIIGEGWGDTGHNYPDDDQWHMFTVVAGTGNTILYIDGEYIQDYGSSIMSPDLSGFVIGATTSFTGNFNGYIDDVRVFSCELMPTDVQQLYNEGNYSLVACLEADYLLENNTNDVTGNSHDGLGTALTSTANRFGVSDRAYLFNGSSSKISIPSTGFDFSTGVTFAAWVKPNSVKESGIVSFMDESSYGIRLTTGDEISPYFKLQVGNTSVYNYAEAFETYYPNNWYHVAASYDPTMGDMLVYVNGQPLGMNMEMGTYDFSGTAFIGQLESGLGYFDGIIDDVKIYDCVLDATDIEALANADFFISKHPVNDTACSNQSFMFECNAFGENLTYQWYFNSSPISGANSSIYEKMMAEITDAGSYYCEVSNGAGFIYSNNVQLIWSSPSINITVGDNILCNGNCNGSLIATVTGGSTPYSYEWDVATGTQTTAEATSLCAGNYSIVVTDNNGCSNSAAYELIQPIALSINTITPTDALCFGENNGTITIIASGGTGILWYNVTGTQQSSGVFSNLSSGDYYVTVTDNNGCEEVSGNVYVGEPTELVINNVWTNDATCYGLCNGYATIDFAGGTLPYQYNAGFGYQSSNLIEDLCAGNYNVTVMDANSCTGSYPITINGPDELIVSASPTNISCNGLEDGQILLTISGGSVITSYDWSTPDGSGIIPGASEQTNLGAGLYNITVTDANNCSASNSASIAEPDAISVVEIKTDALCAGDCNGSIELTVTGGTGTLSYLWSAMDFDSESEDIYDLCADLYSLSITDQNNCQFTDFYEVNEPAPIVFNDISVSDVSCAGVCDGVIQVEVSGGNSPYNYDVGYGQQTSNIINGLCGNSYFVEITDNNGCSETSDEIYIYEPEALVVEEVVNDVSCFDGYNGSIELSISGGTTGYSVEWATSGGFSSSEQWIYDLVAGEYNLTVTDANSCSYLNTIEVHQPSEPLIIYTVSQTNSGCSGLCDGSFQVIAEGGVEPYIYSQDMFNWQSSGNFVNLCPGFYSIYVQDYAGCIMSTSDIQIQETSGFTVDVSVTQDAACGLSNGAAEVDITGGSSNIVINWSNGELGYDADSLPAGMNYVVVADTLNGCSVTEFFNINNVGAATLSGVVTNAICYGGSGGSIDLSVTGGVPPYLYEWTTGDETQDISGLTAGAYDVSVIDDMGCISTRHFVLTQPSALAISFSVTNATCGSADGSVTATVSGGTPPYNYNWSSGGSLATVTGLTAGSFTLTVTDNNGCVKTKNVMLSNEGAPVIVLDSVQAAICSGQGAIYVTVSGGSGTYDFDWSNGATTEDLTGASPGEYILTVQDGTCYAMLEETVPGIVPQTQPICVVTVDVNTGTNLVVWEKVQTSGISHYNIWRESSVPDSYLLVGSVPYDDMSEFTDSVANPFSRSWRYKISAVDSCGHESALSNHHKTIHLTMNVGLSGAVNLIWDDYEGFTFYTYYIHRHTDLNGWEILDSLPKTLHSFANYPPSTEGLWYFVTVSTPFTCSPTSSSKDVGGPYQQSVSNLEDNGISVDIQNIINTQVSIYPNPSNGLFNVVSTDKIEKVRILNIGGQLIREVNSNMNSVEMDIQDVMPGVYIISIKTEKGQAIGKIIKQ